VASSRKVRYSAAGPGAPLVPHTAHAATASNWAHGTTTTSSQLNTPQGWEGSGRNVQAYPQCSGTPATQAEEQHHALTDLVSDKHPTCMCADTAGEYVVSSLSEEVREG
jgi:hypothetical protein